MMDTTLLNPPDNQIICGPDIYFQLICRLTGHPFSVGSTPPPDKFEFNGWVFTKSPYLVGNQIITNDIKLGEELEKLFPKQEPVYERA